MTRARLLSLVLAVSGCHGAPRPESPPARRAVGWDSATAHRVCESPDSVIAGTKDCVLRDQGRRGERIFAPPAAPRP
jgi:hypothetical protein